MLVENIEYLRKRFPQQLEFLKDIENKKSNSTIIVSNSKVGLPTIQIVEEEKTYYLHSKYNPLVEAERLADEVEKKMYEYTKKVTTTNIEENHLGTTQKSSDEDVSYNHILFYGTGMGYHIDVIIKRFPEVSFSIYEPKPEIFNSFFSNRKIDRSFGGLLKNLYLEMVPTDSELHLNHFINEVQEQVLLVTLPSYERIFKRDYETFLQKYNGEIQNKRVNLHTNLVFEKRWTINSIKNFHEVLNTPNILHDIGKEHFKNKPVLLVAAGPSLSEEIENIRYIKDNKLAYIFSVGSAIKVLLKNDIHPDCVLSYDPDSINYTVFTELYNTDITSIPLIFGSSVGFETLEKYKGPKINMITTKDSVSPIFLRFNNRKRVIETISDAPSIAVVTLELLNKLGVNPIILVGQNLAFKNDDYYAEGISYGESENTLLKERAQSKLIKIEDVYGGIVYTDAPFLAMKKHMETYIECYSRYTSIINTTRGGANISGTIFEGLDKVITDRLTSSVVDKDWFDVKTKAAYDLEYLEKKGEELKDSFIRFKESISIMTKLLQGINENKKKGKMDILIRTFPNLDQTFKQFTENKFFLTFLLPMNKIRYDSMIKNLSKANEKKDIMEKLAIIINEVTHFVYFCKIDLETIEPMLKQLFVTIREANN